MFATHFGVIWMNHLHTRPKTSVGSRKSFYNDFDIYRYGLNFHLLSGRTFLCLRGWLIRFFKIIFIVDDFGLIENNSSKCPVDNGMVLLLIQ